MKKYWREMILLGIMAGTLGAMFLIPPIPQSQSYHNFADQRTILKIPHFCDVASNIPFAFLGIMGLALCWKKSPKNASSSWSIFYLGVLLVCFGSAYYHWNPTNQTLLWDRLPMAIGFMALFIGLLSEFINSKLETYLLIPALGAGIASVFYWHYKDDLRFYIWVQAFPLLTIPLLLVLYKGRYTHSLYLIYGLGFYLLAKVSEILDGRIFSLTGQRVSGHTIKHLLAALGPLCIYWMLKKRREKN